MPSSSRAIRERRRRAHRRRRLAALAALLLAAALAVGISIAASGGGAKHAAGGSGARAGTNAAQTSHDAGAQPTGSGATAAQGASAASGRPGTQPVPILMYHVIAPAPANAPFPGLYVTPSEFAAQMQALKAAGWHAVTLDQIAAYWRSGAPLGPGKPLVLTFDNGYQSQYTQALPVLQRLRWVADENIQLTGLPPSQGGLGEGEIRGLLSAGWELDTQGMSHADLIALGPEQLRFQIVEARRLLQQRYHVPVNWFCYPSGHYNAAVIAAVKQAGYAGSTTVVPGWAHAGDDPYTLHRLRVLGGTGPQALLEQISSAREQPPAPASYPG